MSYDLFLFAGEVSGDLHGAKLLEALYAERPTLKVKGVGGPKMRAVGMECLLPMEEFEVMGFIDILSALPKLRRHLRTLKNSLLSAPPKGVVSIDYPGFNLRLAGALHKGGSPSKRIHYICPTVWAWGKGRIGKMEKTLDQLLTILPFEPHLFSSERLQATYVGHPLIAQIAAHEYQAQWHAEYRLGSEQPLLSLFPGSREKEIRRNLPTQLAVARRLKGEYPHIQIALSCVHKELMPLIRREGSDFTPVLHRHRYELMRASHLALATSGTVTLELALHHIPTVVTYAIHPLDRFIAQKLLRIHLPHYALPNIIYGEELFPELFGPHFTQERLYQAAASFMASECNRSLCVNKCKQLRSLLGEKDGSREAARAILTLLYK